MLTAVLFQPLPLGDGFWERRSPLTPLTVQLVNYWCAMDRELRVTTSACRLASQHP
jgi:hypothetical protein